MITFIRTILLYSIVVFIATYLSLFERKLIGRIQLRRGPRYCGYCGILQPVADGLKLFFKRNALKGHFNQSIFAVTFLLFLSLLQFAFLPMPFIGCLVESKYSLFYIIIIHSLINLAEILIGITSNSKYGIIGGLRGVFQKIATDIPYILSLIFVYQFYYSLDLHQIVLNNTASVLLCVGGILFFITVLINTNHIPFDFMEAESELVAGAYTEYGGILFGMIYLSDYLNILFYSILLIDLFMSNFISIFYIKILFIISMIILIRAILPRYLQMHMIEISFSILIPLWCALNVIVVFVNQ